MGLNPLFSKTPPKQVKLSDQTTEVILQRFVKTVTEEIRTEISSLKTSQLVLNVISGVLCLGLAVFCAKAAVDHFNPVRQSTTNVVLNRSTFLPGVSFSYGLGLGGSIIAGYNLYRFVYRPIVVANGIIGTSSDASLTREVFSRIFNHLEQNAEEYISLGHQFFFNCY